MLARPGEAPSLKDALLLEQGGGQTLVECSLSADSPGLIRCRAAAGGRMELELELSSLDSIDVGVDHPSMSSGSLHIGAITANISPDEDTSRSSLQSPLKILRQSDSVSSYLALRCGSIINLTTPKVGSNVSWTPDSCDEVSSIESSAIVSFPLTRLPACLEVYLFSDGLQNFNTVFSGYCRIPLDELASVEKHVHGSFDEGERGAQVVNARQFYSTHSLSIFIDRCTNITGLPADASEIFIRVTLCRWNEGLEEVGMIKSKKIPASLNPVWEQELLLSSGDFELHFADFIMFDLISKGHYGKASLGQVFVFFDELEEGSADRRYLLQHFKDPSIQAGIPGTLKIRLRRICGGPRSEQLSQSAVTLKAAVLPANPFNSAWPSDVIVTANPHVSTTTAINDFVMSPNYDGLYLLSKTFSDACERKRLSSDIKMRKFDFRSGSQGTTMVEAFENQRRNRFPPYRFSSAYLTSSDPKKFSDQV